LNEKKFGRQAARLANDELRSLRSRKSEAESDGISSALAGLAALKPTSSVGRA
jgi:hypothetical protein